MQIRKIIGISLEINELKAFLGILGLPQQDMYWEHPPDVGLPLVYNAMPRNTFKEIKKYLHLNKNAKTDTNDKMYKLRPYLDTLSKFFL